MPTYRCRQGCFSSDADFRCEHGGATGKAIEPVLKGGGGLYLDVYDPLVDHPAIVYQRHVQEIRAKSEKRFKRAQAEGYRRLQEWGEEGTRLNDALTYCPVPPVVRRW